MPFVRVAARHLETVGDAGAVRDLVLAVTAARSGHGYVPQWHADLDDPQTYRRPGHGMQLAEVDRPGGRELVACAGYRPGRALPEPLADRYAGRRRAELVRVAVRPGWERRGLASSLVTRCRRDLADSGDADVIVLHTNVRSAGALDFWLSQGAHLVYDARGAAQRAGEPVLETVYLELDLAP